MKSQSEYTYLSIFLSFLDWAMVEGVVVLGWLQEWKSRS